MFAVFLSNKALKQVKLLDQEMRARVQEVFKTLEKTPLPFKAYNLKKLKGSKDSYRIRLSRHRMLYDVDWHSKKIIVVKIELRSDGTYD